MSPQALITGVSGFAGRHLAEQLLTAGWSVAGTVRTRSSGLADVEERRLEVDDGPAMTELMRQVQPEVVYHLAATVDTVQTPDILALYRTNVIGTAGVLEAVRETASVKRVVIASSAFAYGRVAVDFEPVTEDVALRPVTPYGASKAAAEAIALQWWRDTGVDLMVTRAFQHTGPGHVGPYACADWAFQLAAGSARLTVGNLDVVRDYLDVRDVVAAYRAVAQGGRPGEIYNVGSGVPRTMRSMLAGLMRATGRTVEVRQAQSRLRAVDQPFFIADVSKLVEHTGWAPAYPMSTTLKDLAEFALAMSDSSIDAARGKVVDSMAIGELAATAHGKVRRHGLKDGEDQ